MSMVFDRLLAGVPQYLYKDAEREGALTIFYEGGLGWLTIDAQTLIVRTEGGPNLGFTIPLRGLKLGDLVSQLSAQSGITASLLTDASEPSITLLDQDNTRIDGQSVRVERATSILWALLRCLGWAMQQTLLNAKTGILNLSVKTAEGQWLDLWGQEYYGGVFRRTGEYDSIYAQRIIREVLRWRVNGVAIENILTEELGITARLSNLHEQAFIWCHPRGKYAGRKYSRTTFEVLVDVLDALTLSLEEIVDRNRAAGTLPYYTLRMISSVEETSEETVESPTTITVYAPIGTDWVWSWNQPREGRSWALPGNIGVVEFIMGFASDVMIGVAAGQVFELDESSLDGSDILGEVISGAFTISDEVTLHVAYGPETEFYINLHLKSLNP